MKRFESILLVDDDVLFLRLLSRFIVRPSFDFKDIFLAYNGKEAIELYELKKPDIVLCDTNMPLINGLEVCKYIREKKQDLDTIIIGMSAQRSVAKEWYDLGANSFYDKEKLVNNIYLLQNDI